MKGVEKISRWTGCDTHGFPSSPRALPSCLAFFAMVGIAERGSARATSRRIFARSPIKNSISIKKRSDALFHCFGDSWRHTTQRGACRSSGARQFYTGISQLSVRHPCHAASQPIETSPVAPSLRCCAFEKVVGGEEMRLLTHNMLASNVKVSGHSHARS